MNPEVVENITRVALAPSAGGSCALLVAPRLQVKQ